MAIQKNITKTLLCIGAVVCASTAALAQSQNIRTYHQEPAAIYTYHGAVMAAPPESELAPLATQSATIQETIVEHNPALVAYPDGDIQEPVALAAETIPAVTTHEASLTTTKKLYDSNGNLLQTTQTDHAKGE